MRRYAVNSMISAVTYGSSAPEPGTIEEQGTPYGKLYLHMMAMQADVEAVSAVWKGGFFFIESRVFSV